MKHSFHQRSRRGCQGLNPSVTIVDLGEVAYGRVVSSISFNVYNVDHLSTSWKWLANPLCVNGSHIHMNQRFYSHARPCVNSGKTHHFSLCHAYPRIFILYLHYFFCSFVHARIGLISPTIVTSFVKNIETHMILEVEP